MALSLILPKNPLDCVFENSTDNNTWPYSCEPELLTLYSDIHTYSLVGVLVILVLLSRRENQSTQLRSCLWGHPGTPFPLNMLDGYEYRLAYCAAFGSLTSDLSRLLLSPFDLFTPWSTIFYAHYDIISKYPVLRLMVLFVQVGLTTIINLPYFLTLSSDFKLIASLIGVALISVKICFFAFMTSCIDESYDPLHSPVKSYMFLIQLLPILVCCAALMLQYVINIIECVRKGKLGYYEGNTNVAKSHHVEHVKLLLGKEKLPWHEDDLRNISMLNPRKFWAHFGLKHISGFRFPTRILATFTVTLFSVYQIMVQLAFFVIYLLSIAEKMAECSQVWLPTRIYEFIEPYKSNIVRYLRMTVNIWNGTLGFSGVLLVIYTYLMCISYRRQTLRVYKGDKRIFPSGWSRQSSHTLLTDASKHPGLQIAYTIWGFVIIQVFLFVLVTAIVFVIFIPPIEYQYWNIVIWILHTIVATLALRQVLNWTQLLLTWLFFLQDKVNDSDDGRPLAIDNRRSWYNMSFFFFFWNLFLGVISALLRVLRGIVFGVFFIPRIDRPVLMKGFERFDAGFTAYLSLLTVVNAHDHPVVKVFIQVLMDGVKEPSTSRHSELEDVKIQTKGYDNGLLLTNYQRKSEEKGKPRPLNRNSAAATKRARYYWMLAYTLICNPELLSYRKVEIDELDEPIGGKMKRHKVVLAMHRKQEGKKTSELYD